MKMVELSPSSMTCISGTCEWAGLPQVAIEIATGSNWFPVSDLVHLTCRSVGSAHQDLSPLVTRMFRTTESQEEGEKQNRPGSDQSEQRRRSQYSSSSLLFFCGVMAIWC